MGNERLRGAMRAAHVTVDGLSVAAGVDPKTVSRWIAGRTPTPRHRWTVAEALNETEEFLWPSIQRGVDRTSSELVAIYGSRSDVPASLWWNLLLGAREQIDVLVYAGLFLPEQHGGLMALLRSKAEGDCRIRIALGDPDSPAVKERGDEEVFGDGIESRVRMALRHYSVVSNCSNIAIHTHSTTLYNSIFRMDGGMLVNAHLWGMNAFMAPVFHYRKAHGSRMFDAYSESFDRVWAASRPAFETRSSSDEN